MLLAGKPEERCEAFTRLIADVGVCAACHGMTYARALGPASGSLDAHVLFIAEAAGRRGAARTGVPLTGDESGRRFEHFLTLAGLRRRDVFVTNAVLCNPIGGGGVNRAPKAAEIARCRPFLERTLDVASAPIIVTLGRVALESTRVIAPHDAELSRDASSAIAWYERLLVPMYHPSRQSTLHRSQSQQEDDWRRLGAVASQRGGLVRPTASVARLVP